MKEARRNLGGKVFGDKKASIRAPAEPKKGRIGRGKGLPYRGAKAWRGKKRSHLNTNGE